MTEDLRETVRQRYAEAATAVTAGGSGCCGGEAVTTLELDETFGSALYTQLDRTDLPVAAVAASLGCGNPTAVADLHPGERVLDLGSGGGIDVLLSAKRVGPSGFAYGVDMTSEMLDLARANAAQAGATNVEFLQGTIEDIPLPDAAVDVIISNCVINLSVDKPAVLTEMFRVLTPGGRIGISDVVAEDHLTHDQRAERGEYVGCIAGALSRQEYLDGLAAAGFDAASVEFTHPVADQMHSAIIRATKPGNRDTVTSTPAVTTQLVEPSAVVATGACCTSTEASACCEPEANRLLPHQRHHLGFAGQLRVPRMSSSTATTPVETAPVLRRLSRLDRWLPVWIIAAMLLGLTLGRFIPGLAGALDAVKVGSVSVPIAVGLLVMMYPVLAKVRYTDTGHVLTDKRLLISSLILNWLVCPALMFILAWVFLPDLPEYRTGLIIVGLARCIAMVLIWNDLACGDREAAAVLVAINSVFQVLAFGALGWFYLQTLPSWLGLPTTSAEFSVAAIMISVLVFLGIPLLAGFLTRTIGEKAKGRDWYENRLLPKLGPFALYGLLFTIVILFALQGHTIAERPLDVARIAVPLLIYFAVTFTTGMVAGRLLGLGYPRTTTLAFTAAGNNFELAIAVAIATFGVTSGQALAGVVGPLIEVPVLVGLVYVALWARRFYPADRTPTPADPAGVSS